MPENLNPPGHQPPGANTQGNVAANKGLHPSVWALMGFVVALTLVVLFLLPALMDKTPDKISADATREAEQQLPTVSMGALRSDAEKALKAFLRLRAQPELKNAEVWAIDVWEKTLNVAQEGDHYYGKGDFSAALSSYKKASQQLQSIADSKPQQIVKILSEGWQALEKNQSKIATDAFKRVLAMQEQHTDALAGVKQSMVRNEVLQLMNEGNQAEERGELAQAAMNYKQATQLDSKFLAAQEAESKITILITEAKFQQAMSVALQGLEQGDLKVAATALSKAVAIQPNSVAVKDTQQRLMNAQRRASLANLSRRVKTQVNEENWQAVILLSRKSLAIDSGSLIASNNLNHALARKKLNEQFDHYLGDTTRLSSDEPLANARKLVEANRNIPVNEPRLRSKQDKLQEALRLAIIPVDLIINSDGKTSVTVYHVGRLGTFQQKQLTLRSGLYTVTGSCAGYRDVRKEITLKPDGKQYSIDVRCENQI